MYARELQYAVTHRDSGVEALITYRLMGMVRSHQKVCFEMRSCLKERTLRNFLSRFLLLVVSTEKVMFGNVDFGNIRFVTRMI